MSFFSDIFGGSNTNTVTRNSQPPSQFQSALTGALANVQQVGSTPYTPYTGQMVAQFNPTQGAAFNAVANYANSAQPYFQNAGNAISASTKPLLSSIQQPFNQAIGSWLPNAALNSTMQAAGPSITSAAQQGAGGIMNAAGAYQPGNINQWLSPYTQNVVNATQAQFGNQNAQEASSLAGNAISSGAWGGDRAQVAQGIAAGQEQLAQAPVIANLEQQGYGQALSALGTQSQIGLQGAQAAGSLGLQGAQAQAQQQQATAQQLLGLTQGQQNLQLGANEANAWLNSQAGYGLANIGNAVQSAGLSGANAVLGIGNLAQQQQQANLNVPYEQWVQQQAYPFQTLGWGTGQLEGLSSAAGGTSSTTYPQPSPWSQALGGAAALTGIAGQTGAFGANGWLTGNNTYLGSGIADTGSAFGGASGLANYYNSGVAADTGAAAAGSSYLGARHGGRLAAHAHGGGIEHSPWHVNDNHIWLPREPMRMAAGGYEHHADGNAVGDDWAPDTADMPTDAERASGSAWGRLMSRLGQNWRTGDVAASELYGGAPPRAPQAPHSYPTIASDPMSVASPASSDTGAPIPPRGNEGALWGPLPPSGNMPLDVSSAPAPNARTTASGRFQPPPAPRMGAPSAPAAPQAPGGPDQQAAMPPRQGAGYGPPSDQSASSPSWARALTYAGLGMMAGRSPFALANIGEGALQGLRIYDSDKAREAQLQSISAYRQSEDANRQAQRAEDLRHHQQQESTDQRRIDTLAEEARARLGMEGARVGIEAANSAETQRYHDQLLNQGRLTFVGTDPNTGLPVTLDTRTGAYQVGNVPVGMKPGEAARASMEAEKLAQYRAAGADDRAIKLIQANPALAALPPAQAITAARTALGQPSASPASPAPSGGTQGRPPLQDIFGQ